MIRVSARFPRKPLVGIGNSMGEELQVPNRRRRRLLLYSADWMDKVIAVAMEDLIWRGHKESSFTAARAACVAPVSRNEQGVSYRFCRGRHIPAELGADGKSSSLAIDNSRQTCYR